MTAVGWTCRACRSTLDEPERFCGYDRGCPRKFVLTSAQPPAQPGREEVVSAMCDTLRAIHHMDCYTRDGEELPHLVMMRLAGECLSAAEPLLARQDWPKELDASASMSMDFERRYEVEPAQDVRPEAEELLHELNNLPMVHKGVQFDGWLLSEPTLKAILAALSTLPTEPASVREDVEREIIAWLRLDEHRGSYKARTVADAIERGEHRSALSTEEPKL